MTFKVKEYSNLRDVKYGFHCSPWKKIKLQVFPVEFGCLARASAWAKRRLKSFNDTLMSHRNQLSEKQISHVFLCVITMASEVRSGRPHRGALCFWRSGVRAPFLDGSTVLTNTCTDVDLHWNQQTVNAVFQSCESELSENNTPLPSKSCLHTLLYYSARIWQDQLDLNTGGNSLRDDI